MADADGNEVTEEHLYNGKIPEVPCTRNPIQIRLKQ